MIGEGSFEFVIYSLSLEILIRISDLWLRI